MSSKNVIFDEKNQIWGRFEQHESCNPAMFGQMILNVLSKYGSQLAQVIRQSKFID